MCAYGGFLHHCLPAPNTLVLTDEDAVQDRPERAGSLARDGAVLDVVAVVVDSDVGLRDAVLGSQCHSAGVAGHVVVLPVVLVVASVVGLVVVVLAIVLRIVVVLVLVVLAVLDRRHVAVLVDRDPLILVLRYSGGIALGCRGGRLSGVGRVGRVVGPVLRVPVLGVLARSDSDDLGRGSWGRRNSDDHDACRREDGAGGGSRGGGGSGGGGVDELARLLDGLGVAKRQ